MAVCQLASAGDDIRIWDVNSNFSLVKQYNPHKDNVACLNWSHDNQLLASASTGGDKISITVAKNNLFQPSLDFGVGQNKTCVCFNSDSRCIVSGGKDGEVTLWEMRKKTVHKSYKSHKSSVTTLQISHKDCYVASASESGEIILFNMRSGVESSPLVAPRTQAIRQLQFSHFKKSMLASVSDDGAVNLWDINTRRHIHPFRDVHMAPATGLAFSPLNDMLLLSTGLDKRIVCYDVLNKCAVKTMTAESPLTSIDLLHNGVTFAAGSTRGKIFIYDLRNSLEPVHTISSAHKSSVQFLTFQNNISDLAKTSGPVSLGSVGTRTATSGSLRPASAPVFDKEKAVSNYRSQTPLIKADKTNLEAAGKSHLSRLSGNGSFGAISPLREDTKKKKVPTATLR